MTKRIAILGSFRRFYPEVTRARAEFAATGWLVTTPIGQRVLNPEDPFVRFESDDPGLDDVAIETIAVVRILTADVVFVCSPGGYLGRTTCYEIGRCVEARRPLYFSECPLDIPIAVPSSRVASAQELILRFQRESPAPWS